MYDNHLREAVEAGVMDVATWLNFGASYRGEFEQDAYLRSTTYTKIMSEWAIRGVINIASCYDGKTVAPASYGASYFNAADLEDRPAAKPTQLYDPETGRINCD